MPDVDKYGLIYPGSDRAIVNRSVRYNYEANLQRPVCALHFHSVKLIWKLLNIDEKNTITTT